MPKKKPIIFFLFLGSILLVLLTGLSCFSQNQSFRFDRLTMADGLANPSVLNIIQDEKGFIWISSFIGVSRYDGNEIKNYFPTEEKEENFKYRGVQVLFADSDGGIWLGAVTSAAKLFKYDPQNDRFVPCLYDLEKDEQVIEMVLLKIM